jgi:subtilisin-like proprotein convertase family protein
MSIVVANTGPFAITSPATDNVSWAVGSTQTITWSVAGTTANGINTALVNILLSTDGGATFGTVLASATANDGSQSITLPAGVAVPYARILIEPVGNIYYAVSKNIAIGYTVDVVNTCNTYSASPNTPIQIGANGPQWSIQGTITIPDSFVISDLDLSVNITHPRINDLYIGLLPPGTNQVADILIVYQQGCPTTNTTGMITTFDDEGVNLTCSGIAANNTYKPLNSLTHFDGFNSAGGWRLVIADVVAANNGTLNSFAIEACSTTTTVTLGNESFGFSEFVVYPNPNNGNFNVRFNDASANGVKVLVHDMRGRKIYENSYSGGASFNENIQLDNAQSGIYLMTVTDGARKEVKRIVVE